MMAKKLKLLTLPVVLLLLLMLEGVLAVYFIAQLISPNFQMAIQLFSTAIFFMTCYITTVNLLPMILVLGLVYDMYYSPVLSFYTIPLVIVYLIIRYLAPQIKATFLRNIGLMAIANVLYNILTYVEAIFLNLYRSEFIVYVQQKVFPTLFFNLVLFFILYFPLVKLFKWINHSVEIKMSKI